jgi:hypothetical protein
MRTAPDVRLEPDGPPLRRTAKARPFRSEIARLYLEGHTCKTIRKALAKVGVHVSESTVRREIARPRPRQLETAAANPRAGQEVSPKALPPHLLLASDRRTGKEIAEDFVKGRITNPLLRSRSPT